MTRQAHARSLFLRIGAQVKREKNLCDIMGDGITERLRTLRARLKRVYRALGGQVPSLNRDEEITGAIQDWERFRKETGT
jgi:hypothetical protein